MELQQNYEPVTEAGSAEPASGRWRVAAHWPVGYDVVDLEAPVAYDVVDEPTAVPAERLAEALRGSGVGGNPQAVNLGDGWGVVLTHPSGRDWIVAAVAGGPSSALAVVYVAVSADDDAYHAAPAVEVHSLASAERTIFALATAPAGEQR